MVHDIKGIVLFPIKVSGPLHHITANLEYPLDFTYIADTN